MKETSQEDIEQINDYFQATIGNDSASIEEKRKCIQDTTRQLASDTNYT